jgi:hypothetical protein
MLSCYTAAFDRGEDCLAEEMLRTSGGPVAVYGGSRVTMPYAMAVMGSEMLREYFENRPATLGEVIKNAKRRMALPPDENQGLKNANRLLLDGVASVLSPARDMLSEERREHLHLFNLLGDPLLTLSYPQVVKVETATQAAPGNTLQVKVESPVSGRMLMELVSRRDVPKVELPPRDRFDPSSAALARLQETYQQANDCVWCRQEVDLRSRTAVDPAKGIAIHGLLVVPQEARGAAHVRVFVEGEKDYATGAANLYIRPPETARPAAP